MNYTRHVVEACNAWCSFIGDEIERHPKGIVHNAFVQVYASIQSHLWRIESIENISYAVWGYVDKQSVI